jgi:DNA primase catalytic subunit
MAVQQMLVNDVRRMRVCITAAAEQRVWLDTVYLQVPVLRVIRVLESAERVVAPMTTNVRMETVSNPLRQALVPVQVQIQVQTQNVAMEIKTESGWVVVIQAIEFKTSLPRYSAFFLQIIPVVVVGKENSVMMATPQMEMDVIVSVGKKSVATV